MNNLETVINVLLQKSGKEIFLKILFTGLIKNKILRLSIEELSRIFHLHKIFYSAIFNLHIVEIT